MTRQQRNAGFTLISVLVALVMLTFGLMALARVQLGLMNTQRGSATRTTALDLARAYTEDIRSRDPNTLASEAAVNVDERGIVSIGGKYIRTVAVADDAVQANVSRVTVQIAYPNGINPISITTMIYRGGL